MKTRGGWRRALAGAAVVVLAFAIGCGDDSSNPNPPGDLAQQATALFPAGAARDEALTIITTLESSSGAAADAAAFDLTSLSLDEYAAGRLSGTAAAQRSGLSDLITDAFTTAGLSDPGLSPESFDTDGVVAVVDAAGGDFVTGTEHAGINIPASALSRNVLLVINRLPDSSQYAPGDGPLPTTLNQYPLFYDFHVTPSVTFAADAILGLCQVTESASAYYAPDPILSRLQIAHPDPATPTTIELLPRADAPFLDCDGVTAGNGVAMLLARRAGIGGRVRNFSPFGAVDPQPGPPPDQFSLTYCSDADAPIWVAQQNGNGAWTQVLPASGTNTYTFSLPSGRGGIASAYEFNGGFSVAFSYATLSEQRANVTFLNRYCGDKTVNGSVAGVGAAEFSAVRQGFGEEFAGGTAGASTFQLLGVTSGPLDLVGARHDDATERVNRFLLRRGVDAADGSTLPVADFGSAEAFAPASATATLSGLAGESAQVYTALGTFFYPVLSYGTFDVTTTTPYDALPVAQLAPGEVQRMVGYAEAESGEWRRAEVYYRDVVDRTLAFGPAAVTPTVTTATGTTYSRPRIQMPVQAEYNKAIEVSFEQGSGSTYRQAFYRASSNYYATAPVTWDLVYPDLTGVAGFSAAWALQKGENADWGVWVFGGEYIPFNAETAPADGATYRLAFRGGGPFTALRKAMAHGAPPVKHGLGWAPVPRKH